MKAADLRGMSDEQLAVTLKETEKHLFQLRFQSATDRLETPSEIVKARKDIARIKTVQRQRELAKVVAATDEQLVSASKRLEAKTEGPGKRKAKRGLARIASITLQRAAQKKKANKPAKGK